MDLELHLDMDPDMNMKMNLDINMDKDLNMSLDTNCQAVETSVMEKVRKTATTATKNLQRIIYFSGLLYYHDVSVCVCYLVECELRKPFI